MAKRTVQTIQTETVDKNTGEVLTFESKKVFTEKINPEHFYMVQMWDEEEKNPD